MKSDKVAAELSKALETQMRAHNVEVVVILSDPVLRGAIKAISWLTGMSLAPAKDSRGCPPPSQRIAA